MVFPWFGEYKSMVRPNLHHARWYRHHQCTSDKGSESVSGRPYIQDFHELVLVPVEGLLVVFPCTVRDLFLHQHTQNQKCNTFDLDAALHLVLASKLVADIYWTWNFVSSSKLQYHSLFLARSCSCRGRTTGLVVFFELDRLHLAWHVVQRQHQNLRPCREYFYRAYSKSRFYRHSSGSNAPQITPSLVQLMNHRKSDCRPGCESEQKVRIWE